MTGKTPKWIEDQEYLPPALRDFHDQKDVFKSMVPMIHNYNKSQDSQICRSVCEVKNWTDLHCWTIDVVLRFFAIRGYTLQPMPKHLREKRGCLDLSETVADHKKEMISLMTAPAFGSVKS